MNIFVETGRLLLRELLPQDEQGLFELDSDPEVHRYLGNQPITSLEQAREIIPFIRQQYVDNGIGRWAIIEKQSGEFVGWTGLKLVKEQTGPYVNYYDLGYRLIRKHWGKGYASETAIASVNYGFEKLRLEKIYASAQAANLASNRVIQKTGLKFVESLEEEGAVVNWYKIDRPGWEQHSKNIIIAP